MVVSQKTKYALRGLFQLAAKGSSEPVKVAELARAQHVPVRFLEVIFAELKQAGIVASRRGNEGGYLLARPADRITVGEIIRFVQGPVAPRRSVNDGQAKNPQVFGDYAFQNLWEDINDAISKIYDNKTLADLVREEMQHKQRYIANYCI